MIAHILYIFSLILFFFSLSYYINKSRQYKKNPDSVTDIKKYDSLFFILFIFIAIVNVFCNIYIIYQNQYMQSYFSWIGAPIFFTFMIHFPLGRFLFKKYQNDRNESRTKPKKSNSVYIEAVFCTSIITAFIPSYLLFGVFHLPIDQTKLSEPLLLTILISLSIYQLIISFFRILQKEKKNVSYASFGICIIALLISSYCYNLLLDFYFIPAVGPEGFLTMFTYTGALLLILYLIATIQAEKRLFKDKKECSWKDGFLVLEITDIVEGIVLPLAAVLFCVLNHFNLITA